MRPSPPTRESPNRGTHINHTIDQSHKSRDFDYVLDGEGDVGEVDPPDAQASDKGRDADGDTA